MKVNTDGITLPELLVSMAIISVLISMSLPSYVPVVNQHRADRMMSTLTSALTSARSAAIRHGTWVTVCPSSDGLNCSGTWSDGLVIFLDPERDRIPPGGNSRLFTAQWPGNNGELRWRAFGNRQYLQIDALGNLGHQNGNFTWCPASGELKQARQLIINSLGRIRQAEDINGDGYRQDSQGRRLNCI